MSCNVNKFVITKGIDNTFVFTIKANGTTLPMTIDDNDTFEASLILLEGNSTSLIKELSVIDVDSGKVSLTVTASEADSLSSDRGSKTDRYYLRPTYKLVIDCSTLNNGDFIAKVPEVYVD